MKPCGTGEYWKNLSTILGQQSSHICFRTSVVLDLPKCHKTKMQCTSNMKSAKNYVVSSEVVVPWDCKQTRTRN